MSLLHKYESFCGYIITVDPGGYASCAWAYDGSINSHCVFDWLVSHYDPYDD